MTIQDNSIQNDDSGEQLTRPLDESTFGKVEPNSEQSFHQKRPKELFREIGYFVLDC